MNNIGINSLNGFSEPLYKRSNLEDLSELPQICNYYLGAFGDDRSYKRTNREDFLELPKTSVNYYNTSFDGYDSEARHINEEANINGLKVAAQYPTNSTKKSRSFSTGASEAVAVYTNARLRDQVLVKHKSNKSFKRKAIKFLNDTGSSLKTRVCASLGGTLAALADAASNAAGVVFNLVKAGVYLVGTAYTIAGGIGQFVLNLGGLAVTGRICVKEVKMEDLTRRLNGLGSGIKGAIVCFGKAVGYAVGSPFILILGAISPKNLVRALGANNVVDLDAANRAYVQQKNEVIKAEVEKVKVVKAIKNVLSSEAAIEQAEQKNISNKMNKRINYFDSPQYEAHFNAERENLQGRWNKFYEINNRKFIQSNALEHLNDLATAPSLFGRKHKPVVLNFDVPTEQDSNIKTAIESLNNEATYGRRPAANAHVRQEQGSKGNVDGEPMSDVGFSDFVYAAFRRKPVRSPDVTLNVGERPDIRPSLRQRMGNALNGVTKRVRFPSSSVAPSAVELGQTAPATVAPATSGVSLSSSVSSASAQGPNVAVSVSSASYASSPSPAAASFDLPAPAVAVAVAPAPAAATSTAQAATEQPAPTQTGLFGRIRSLIGSRPAPTPAPAPAVGNYDHGLHINEMF